MPPLTPSSIAMPHVARIILYPIKSLPGIEVGQAELTPAGTKAKLV